MQTYPWALSRTGEASWTTWTPWQVWRVMLDREPGMMQVKHHACGTTSACKLAGWHQESGRVPDTKLTGTFSYTSWRLEVV